MNKIEIIPFDVIERKDLSVISVDHIPSEGDPVEINGELYFVCEQDLNQQGPHQVIGVIPLVVKDPVKVANIGKYIECLSIAHRKVRFRNEKGNCDLVDCNEMIIS